MAYAMKKAENNDKEWELCPPGMQQAVLADILDCGWVEKFFEGKSQGKKPEIKLIWQSINVDSEGHRILVFDFPMILSFNEKSSLYKRLASWLGKNALEKMLTEGADFESLIGQNAFINIEHVPSKRDPDRIFANISTIAPLVPGMQPIQVEHYVRLCERENWEERAPHPSAFEMYVSPRAQQLPTVANGNGAANGTNGTAPAHATMPTPVPAFEPIDGQTVAQLYSTGGRLWGNAAHAELEKLALEVSGGQRRTADLSREEGAMLRDRLAKMNPAKAMLARYGNSAGGNAGGAADGDNDDSIFDGE